jgi:hypothetical protein
MSTGHYVHLHPTGIDGSDGAKSDEELVAEGWWCHACRSPKPETGAIDFQIIQKKPVNSPICSAAYFGVRFARRDFLALLGEENVATDLLLGTLMGPAGEVIEDWVTVRARHNLIVRGGLSVGFEHFVGSRLCEVCGNRIYSAYAPNYLYPAPDPTVQIFQSQLGGLVVPYDLFAPLGLKRKRGFGIETLKILDKPRDKLGELK